MTRAWPIETRLALILCIAPLIGCATQPEVRGDHPGFLAGLLHGFIAIPSLAASIFMQVRIYAFPNDGFSYDAGFVLGFGTSILLVMMACMARIGGYLTTRMR